jgi:hypothetical protein
LSIANEAGRYFDCRRTIAAGFNSLQGLESESALLAKLPPGNEWVIDETIRFCIIGHSWPLPRPVTPLQRRKENLTKLLRPSSYQLGGRFDSDSTKHHATKL